MGEGKGKYFLIAAGGTGGHVFPGIAIAEEIAGMTPAAEIRFAGTERGLEAGIVPQRGWPLMLIKSHSLKDRKGFAKICAALALPVSVLRASAMLASRRPSVLISIGGYAAGPLCLAAWIQRIPVMLVEPNAIPGLTNRMLARFAKRVFVSYPEAAPAFGRKAAISGTPVRRSILEARHGARDGSARATVFVFGGSQGARTLNRGMVAALPWLAPLRERISIVHQTGGNDDPLSIERAYAEAGIEATVFEFTDRMWECYERADIVIARSGANTVAEVSALGIPAVLVPYPHAADDHQRANAEALVRAGGAVMVADSEFTGERVSREISSLIEDRQRLESMRAGALGFGRPDAARSIARECMAAAGGQGGS